MQNLPIDELIDEIILALSKHGALVIQAEPGAGKTTRVPPAILDAGLANSPDGAPGEIVVLQPRRIAARAAAFRVADERNTAVGDEIGYQVRHESKSSKSTRIIFCTEGVFLRRLQDDPTLDGISVVVFDEFHERSINADLALALTMQVRKDIREDLKVVVTSATLDTKPIAQYMNDCPIVESPGRTYPVTVEYLKFPSNDKIPDLVARGVRETLPNSEGSILAFLPGVWEINRAKEILDSNISDVEITPLYGDMSLGAQQDVLKASKKKKVVLATNVAETSITIDGVTTVVDSGYARINSFDAARGINRLETIRVSKASAAQRAGRAGRTSPGNCLRLWTEKEQLMMNDFETPEIARVDITECVLQLLLWGEHDIESFFWFQAPPKSAIKGALKLLEFLGATEQGKLTSLGRAMATLPLQPRLARLLLEGSARGESNRASLCASLLSEKSPFRSVVDSGEVKHHTESDVLEQLKAIEQFEEFGHKDSIMGHLNPREAKRILKSANQLHRLVSRDSARKSDSQPEATNDTISSDEAILRAILSAFPDRVCKRREANSDRAVMTGGKGIRLSPPSTVYDAPLFVAVETIDLNKQELSVRRASKIEQSWLSESLIERSIDVEFDRSREKVVAKKRTKYGDLILSESITKIPSGEDPGTVLARELPSHFDIESLIDYPSREYLTRLNWLRETLPELELPNFGNEPWIRLLPMWCCGCSSVSDLRTTSVIPAIQSSLSAEQIMAIDTEAPERIEIPTGKKIKLSYEVGKPPVLAARIQDLFGLKETPRVARNKASVLLHLLAPNFRPQQVTDDIASFWKNTYPIVRKELRGRYPKHAWPEDPLSGR